MTAVPNDLTDWLGAHAHAVSLDVDSEAMDLPHVLARASIVGVGSSARNVSEHARITHSLMRALIVHAGFRGVFIEGTETPYNTAAKLDRYVMTGDGNPADLLQASQSFLHTREVLDGIEWVRQWARDHPGDEVRIVHDIDPVTEPPELEAVERDLADRDLAWLDRTGDRIVHWGGTAHTIAAEARRLAWAPEQTHPSAGAYMRRALGGSYAAVALTAGAGSPPLELPSPPDSFTEAALDRIGSPVLLVTEDSRNGPDSVRDWSRNLRTRVIGPAYDPARHEMARVDIDDLWSAVDVLVHVPEVTATIGLPLPSA